LNIVNFNDADFTNTKEYKDFVKQNPSKGYLSIRAYAANQAVPISGLRVIVSQNFGNTKVIFFQGTTDNSGTINQIALPAPESGNNDLVAPRVAKYDIEALYDKSNIDLFFKINIYSNIQVVQDINIVPEIRLFGGNIYGN